MTVQFHDDPFCIKLSFGLLCCSGGGLISDKSKKSELHSVHSENGQLPPRSGICLSKRPFVCHATTCDCHERTFCHACSSLKIKLELFCVFLSLLPMLLSIQCLVLLLAYKLFAFDYITSGLLTRKHYRLRCRAASPRAASLITFCSSTQT